MATKIGSLSTSSDFAEIQEVKALSVESCTATTDIGVISTDIMLPEVTMLDTNFTSTTSQLLNNNYRYFAIKPDILFARIPSLSAYSAKYVQVSAITLVNKSYNASNYPSLKVVAAKTDTSNPLDESCFIAQTEVKAMPATIKIEVKYEFNAPFALDKSEKIYFYFYNNNALLTSAGLRAVKDENYVSSKIPVEPCEQNLQGYAGYWIPCFKLHFSTTKQIAPRLADLEAAIG